MTSRFFTYLFSGLSIFALAFILLSQNDKNKQDLKIMQSFEVFSYETPTLSLSLNNSYQDSFDLYPFDYLVAVYTPTYLTATSDIDYPYARYQWKIQGSSYDGQTVTHSFTETGWITIEVKITYGDEKLESTQTFRLMSRYVRREMRALTDEDRDKVLSAMETLYYTSTTVGRTIYGDNYRSISDFMLDHLNGAAQKMCDHWHDDAAILVHHLAFTLDFENALHLVDPSVALPYWEYTYDSYIYGTDWEDSEIFYPDWFSVASPTNSLHMITEGRWAFLSVKQQAEEFTHYVNPFGLLRSPWNTNAVPYVTRHDRVLDEESFTEFPTCSQFSTAFSSSTISEINFFLNGGLHGPVHILIGGHWNPFTNTQVAENLPNIEDTLLLSKTLWRLGFARCPETCEEGSQATCQCSCPDYLRQGMSAYEVLEYAKILHLIVSENNDFSYDDDSQIYKFSNMDDDEQDDTWEVLLSVLCSFGHAGEMFTSSAPYDPTFWVIHTSAERFLQYRRFSSYYGTNALNETWGFDLDLTTASDFRRVCEWEGVGVDELPTCTTGTCPGHFMHDVLPEQNLVSGVDRFTNSEFYAFLDPRNEDLPYIYDNFDWDHCTEQGITFDF